MSLAGSQEVKVIFNGVDNVSKSVKSIKLGLTGLAVGIAAVAAAAVAMGVGVAYSVSKIVKETQAYSLAIADLSKAFSMSAEDASVIFNIADDLRIELPAVEMAFKKMSQNGIQPSLQGLMKLADKWNAIHDPARKAAFLVDNFGKSGLDMSRIMELGSAGIARLAQDMDKGLILTQANIDASLAYYKAMDNVQDSLLGLKLSVGAAFLPFLTSLSDTLSTWISENGPAIKEFFTSVGNMWTGFVNSDFVAKANLIRERLGYGISQAFSGVKTIVGSALSGLFEGLGASGIKIDFSAISAGITTMLIHFRDWAENVGPKVNEFFVKVGEGIRSFAGWVQNSLIPAVQSAVIWFNDNLAPILQKIAAIIGFTLGPVLNVMWEVLKAIAIAIAAVVVWIGTTLWDVIVLWFNYWKKNVLPMIDRFLTAWINIKTGIDNAITSIGNLIAKIKQFKLPASLQTFIDFFSHHSLSIAEQGIYGTIDAMNKLGAVGMPGVNVALAPALGGGGSASSSAELLEIRDDIRWMTRRLPTTIRDAIVSER